VANERGPSAGNSGPISRRQFSPLWASFCDALLSEAGPGLTAVVIVNLLFVKFAHEGIAALSPGEQTALGKAGCLVYLVLISITLIGLGFLVCGTAKNFLAKHRGR
jgi:hypothetical protein